MNASYLLRCLHFYSYFEVVVLQVLKYIVIYVVCLLQTMCVCVCAVCTWKYRCRSHVWQVLWSTPTVDEN